MRYFIQSFFLRRGRKLSWIAINIHVQISQNRIIRQHVNFSFIKKDKGLKFINIKVLNVKIGLK